MSSSDPHVIALQKLCSRVGGHDALAAAIGANGQSIYQIISERKLPSGNPKGVGPSLRMKISERYPDWLRDEAQGADAENAALCVNAELRVALDAVATALKAADDLTLDQVRPLLARLVDEPFRANEIVSRLAALLETRSDRLQVETEVFAGAPPPGRNGKSPLTQANRGKASSEFFKK